MKFLISRHPTHLWVCFSSRGIVHELFSVLSCHSEYRVKFLLNSFPNSITWLARNSYQIFYLKSQVFTRVLKGSAKNLELLIKKTQDFSYKSVLQQRRIQVTLRKYHGVGIIDCCNRFSTPVHRGLSSDRGLDLLVVLWPILLSLIAWERPSKGPK